jgi:hypothetical protein
VRIVIVPGPDCADVTDPAAPLAGRDFLDAIEAALAAVAGPGVQIHVVNPVYLRLRVSARIQWRADADPHMAALHLNTALVEYLSSWRDVPPHHEYWSETEIQRFVRSQSDVESLASIDFEYEAAGPADPDREVCLVTSAATHHIITSTAAPVSVMDGY